MKKLIYSHLRHLPSKVVATIHSHFLHCKTSARQAEKSSCEILHLPTPILPPQDPVFYYPYINTRK